MNSVIQGELSEKGVLGNILNLVFQLIPDPEVQYVVLEELECRDDFLRAGLIIETDEACEHTYIVPKESLIVLSNNNNLIRKQHLSNGKCFH